MTTVTPTRARVARSQLLPRRRTLVGLALVFVAALLAFLTLGGDLSADSSVAEIEDAVGGTSEAAVQVLSYAAVAGAAAVLAFGAALRAVLRTGGTWYADLALVGFVLVGLTLVLWAVSGLALWHAVDIGDTAMIRSANLADTTGFLPLMLGMTCAYLGTGLAGLRRGLPSWLAIASVGLGVLAPLGPGAFVPAMLFPVWLITIAAAVRRPAAEG